MEDELARRAARQHGVLSRAQLLEVGLSSDAIDHRLRAGRLCQIHRGVYGIGHLPSSLLARATAAVLACGPDLREGPTRSTLEDAFLRFVERYDLPRPEVNATVAGYEVDALYRAQRLVVELDTRNYHGHDQAFERDRDKDAASSPPATPPSASPAPASKRPPTARPPACAPCSPRAERQEPGATAQVSSRRLQ